MPSPPQRFDRWTELIYGLAILVFAALLAFELGATTSTGESAPPDRAGSAFGIREAYTLLLWIVIPLSIFAVHQWNSAKQFRVLLRERADRLNSPVDEQAPLVSSKAPVEEVALRDG